MHASSIIIPDRKYEHHSSIHGFAHTGESSRRAEFVRVSSYGLGLLAECIRDLVRGGNAWDIRVGLLNDLAVLDIQATDGSQSAGGGIIAGDELSYDSHLGLGVHEAGSTIEGLVSPSVRVEVATILVAVRRVSFTANTAGGARSTWAVNGA